LVIDPSDLFGEGATFLERALQLSTNTVKYLKVIANIRGEYPYCTLPSLYVLTPHTPAGTTATIRRFRQLRELELVVDQPSSPHEILLSSITSTKLRKIVFSAEYMQDCRIFAQRMEAWAPIDKLLCELVDRLRETRYRHTLEVELRLTYMEDDPGEYDFIKFLPEFREKGIVTIKDAVHGDRVLHSSTHNR
jgi:hypothetical protein